MAINFNKPVNTDLSDGVLAQLRENINSILTQTIGTGTNIPSGAIRLNPSTGIPESWNGSVWSRFALIAQADKFLTRSIDETGIAANKFFVYNGTNFVVKSLQELVASGDEWVTIASSGTYVSATSFTVSGDVTSWVKKGMPIKLTNSTVKYGYVSSVSYSAPNTTITLVSNNDYSLTNTTITGVFTSYSSSPSGFPIWFNYTPSSIVGFSVNPTAIRRFCILDGVCKVVCTVTAYGTSNATTYTESSPIVSKTVSSMQWFGNVPFLRDNGANLTTPGLIYIPSNSSTMELYKASNAATWTNTAGKGASYTLEFEI